MSEEEIAEDFLPEKNQEKISRDEMLSILAEVIRALHQKCINGRFRDAESEKLRDSKLRILVSAIGQAESILQAQQIEALALKVSALEVSLQQKGGKKK